MLVEKKIQFREKESLNDLATVDRAIQTLKKTLTKFEISPTLGNWAEELQNATEAHNKNTHTHLLGCPPQYVADYKLSHFELYCT